MITDEQLKCLIEMGEKLEHVVCEPNAIADVARELLEWRGNHARVLANARPSDEVHCSCCGDLRLEIERLHAELSEARRELEDRDRRLINLTGEIEDFLNDTRERPAIEKLEQAMNDYGERE